MDSWDTEYIIPSEISKRKKEHDDRYTNKKKECNRKTEIQKNILAIDELEENETTRIALCHENHRDQKARQ